MMEDRRELVQCPQNSQAKAALPALRCDIRLATVWYVPSKATSGQQKQAGFRYEENKETTKARKAWKILNAGKIRLQE